MKESGRPLALTSDGQPVALVHDLLSYYETEDRRKKLVSILDGTRKLMEAAANHPPTATLRTEGQEKEIAELARCSKRVEELKIQIEAWKERVKPFQDRLATIQRELDEAEIARAKSLELVTKKRESSEFSRPTQGT